MIEDWIDEVAKVFEFTDPKNRTVRSFRLFGTDNFPESISVADGPVALTIPGGVPTGEISKGNGTILFWKGVTEIHVTKDLGKGHLPLLTKYFGCIIKACAAKLQLGGAVPSVAHFEIDFASGGIDGPLELQYGQEDKHWGFLVYWEVKEMLGSAAVPVSL